MKWFKKDPFIEKLNNNLLKISALLDKTTLSELIVENKVGKVDNGDFILGLMMLKYINL